MKRNKLDKKGTSQKIQAKRYKLKIQAKDTTAKSSRRSFIISQRDHRSSTRIGDRMEMG